PVEPPVEPPVNNTEDLHSKILDFCKTAKSKQEIAAEIGYKDAKSLVKRHLKPLVEQGKLSLTIPDKPTSRNQKYKTII
ncbi:MAG: AAA family ATPase, partial [Oscillospiraceae bacterium]|nr:AAA family ATPase [Oscillospiraceae bacterium]